MFAWILKDDDDDDDDEDDDDDDDDEGGIIISFGASNTSMQDQTGSDRIKQDQKETDRNIQEYTGLYQI